MKFTKKLLALMLSGVLALSLAACGNEDDSSKETTKAPTSTTTTTANEDSDVAHDTKLTDPEGNEVTIPESVEKIISTAPNVTEILVGLGLGEKIVGTDTYSVGIEGVKSDIAAFDMMSPDLETIIALSPDVVFLSEISTINENGEDKYSSLKNAGIKVINVPTATSLQKIMDDIDFISDYTKTSDKGDKLVNDMKEVIDEVKALSSKLEKKPKVYFEISAAPYLYTFGKETFLNEIIEICGGENIYSSENGFISNTEETVISANPDIILSNVSYEGYDYKEILTRKGWTDIKAIKDNKVYLIDANSSSRSSQNVVKAIKEISDKICENIIAD